MQKLRLFFGALILFLLSCPLGVAVAASPRYEALKARAFKLRNTDTLVTAASDWRDTARELVDLARGQDSESASALFQAATLYETLYRAHKYKNDFDNAAACLAFLVLQYPNDRLADDALLRQGDIFIEFRAQPVVAEQSYSRLVRQYPSSDTFGLAKARLRALSGDAQSMEEKPTVKLSESSFRVMIDPGHGGEDLGAEGPAGLLEKDVVLDVARRLQSALQKRNIVSDMTRHADVFVPLAHRTEKANHWKADVFISLHANASEKSLISGTQTYYLDTSGDEASKLLAQRENQSGASQGQTADLQFMLSDLIQGAKIEDSKRLALLSHEALLKVLARQPGQPKSRGLKKAPFYVLVGAHMPCILIELLFIDNPQDVALLADERVRSQMAEALAEAVEMFRRTQKRI